MQSYETKNVFVTSSVLSVPSANSYTVFLPNMLKDVHRVDLLSATYNGVVTAGPVYLDVEELRSPVLNMSATANVASPSIIQSTFAVLSGMTSQGTSLMRFTSGSHYPVVVNYPYPIQRVDRFTVRWTDNKGKSLDFTGESSFLLRVHTRF